MRTPAAVASLVAVLLPAGALASESSIRCDRGIVQVGETEVDLLGKCGQPALRDVVVAEAGAATVRQAPLAVDGVATTARVEQWTFNFGPNRFVMIVTLESGRVLRIERGSYGYDPERIERRDPRPCESSAIRVGDRKLDLLAKCGPPTTRDVRQEKRAASTPAATAGATNVSFVTVQLEIWTYDLGPSRFITIATIENGVVVAVEHGGYGYGS